jgi:hypothetical protein
VERDSACYGCHEPDDEVGLDANHMEMNKFGSRDESNYRRLLQRLRHIHDEATITVEFRLSSMHSLLSLW